MQLPPFWLVQIPGDPLPAAGELDQVLVMSSGSKPMVVCGPGVQLRKSWAEPHYQLYPLGLRLTPPIGLLFVAEKYPAMP